MHELKHADLVAASDKSGYYWTIQDGRGLGFRAGVETLVRLRDLLDKVLMTPTAQDHLEFDKFVKERIDELED